MKNLKQHKGEKKMKKEINPKDYKSNELRALLNDLKDGDSIAYLNGFEIRRINDKYDYKQDGLIIETELSLDDTVQQIIYDEFNS